MYLLDTNILSEWRKGRYGNQGVSAFVANVKAADLYVSVVTLGEIRRGIERLDLRGDAFGANRLEAWLATLITDFGDRILLFDLQCAMLWGQLTCPDPAHPIDKQIAATALVYDLTLVTRNVKDFAATGVRVENPFR